GTGGCSQDRCHCGRLAVLGSYHTVAWLHDVPEDADALDDLRGALTHERLIGSDVGLALCGVDQQGIDGAPGGGGQLDGSWKACATQPDDASGRDALEQILRFMFERIL